MNGAEIFSLAGSRHVATSEELALALRERSRGANHFEISPSPPRFPILTLMVNGDYAVLHYFSSADDIGAQSRANLHAVPSVVDFPDPGGAVVTLSGSAVVDVVSAERCAVEFVTSWDRPAGVEWRVL